MFNQLLTYVGLWNIWWMA